MYYSITLEPKPNGSERLQIVFASNSENDYMNVFIGASNDDAFCIEPSSIKRLRDVLCKIYPED